MATENVTAAALVIYTPSEFEKVSTAKPVALLGCGENEKGKFVRLAFDDETTRPLYLLTLADAWHPVFKSLDDWETIWKIRRHFSPEVKEAQPDGTHKIRGVLSFQSKQVSKRGAYVCSLDFDIPKEKYSRGRVRGMLAAQELLDVMRLPDGPTPHFPNLIEALAKAMEDRKGSNGKDATWGAATGFLDILEGVLQYGARHCYYSDFITRRVASELSYEEYRDKKDQEDKAAFVERMRVARQNKKPKKATPPELRLAA